MTRRLYATALLLALCAAVLFSQGASAWSTPFDGPWHSGPWDGNGPWDSGPLHNNGPWHGGPWH